MTRKGLTSRAVASCSLLAGANHSSCALLKQTLPLRFGFLLLTQFRTSLVGKRNQVLREEK